MANPIPDLSGLNVFVGGPIQHAIQGTGFHDPLRDAISDVIEAVRIANGTVFSAHEAERFGADTARFTPDQVAVRDFSWMRRCDVFVPVLPVDESGELLRTDGTHVELGWASALDKPIVVVTSAPVSEHASHLLRGLRSAARVSFFDITRIRRDRAHLLALLESGALEVAR
ncbi:hypothetical protein FKR81_36870 [Lentzea tibetensis]|uniref:Nucleoside 2-deoxyribosyltransferase n=1 Tax=Lentzea tibetensis TaxID=2591470 RepID=A0A563EHM1_9PSEU|nr:nucleoside 2-deoxyribosyltransferase [Lentzea tibetensis]TWP46110.1 hypothetical protein FKR81_36870 [Lentzea tibetensis]